MNPLNKFDLISYAAEFVSFLLRDDQLNKEEIKGVILFGSAARGDFGPESDIDLFINLYRKDSEEKIRETIQKRLDKFYRSESYERWELRGIENEINLKIGVLDEWELKQSIVAEGISLYGEYQEVPEGTEMSLFTFEPIKPVKRRNKVIRKIFGRSDTRSKGMVEKLSGRKLTPRSFMVPRKNTSEVKKFLDRNDVNYEMFQIYLGS